MQYEACLGDAQCSCAIDCIAMGGDPLTCQSDCNANSPASNAILSCGQMNCLAQCL
jgi:hypothetical protein